MKILKIPKRINTLFFITIIGIDLFIVNRAFAFSWDGSFPPGPILPLAKMKVEEDYNPVVPSDIFSDILSWPREESVSQTSSSSAAETSSSSTTETSSSSTIEDRTVPKPKQKNQEIYDIIKNLYKKCQDYIKEAEEASNSNREKLENIIKDLYENQASGTSIIIVKSSVSEDILKIPNLDDIVENLYKVYQDYKKEAEEATDKEKARKAEILRDIYYNLWLNLINAIVEKKK
jgi:DNA-binding ferritin-like protein